jgi:sterol 3beta-glucosyltransferase
VGRRAVVADPHAGAATSNPVAQIAIIVDNLVETQRRMVQELLELAPEHDVVVYQPLLVAAPAAARARNVPHVSLQLMPMHSARSYSPMGRDLGPRLNGALWWLARRLLRRATDSTLNTIVEAAGLSPWRDVLADASPSSLLDIVAVSPRILQRDPAWPASSHLTGYLFLDEPDFAPDPALSAFVEGEPPVVIGFGSMHGFDAEATTRTILDAVRDLPRKVVLQAGWAGLGHAELPAHVHLAKFVPHSWLFPRAACVVHHGGAGTTAAAFRAGIPQTFVSHFGDQPGWARLAKARGVSAGSVPQRKLRSRWLRERIDRMLADAGLLGLAYARRGDPRRDGRNVGRGADRARCGAWIKAATHSNLDESYFADHPRTSVTLGRQVRGASRRGARPRPEASLGLAVRHDDQDGGRRVRTNVG